MKHGTYIDPKQVRLTVKYLCSSDKIDDIINKMSTTSEERDMSIEFQVNSCSLSGHDSTFAKLSDFKIVQGHVRQANSSRI